MTDTYHKRGIDPQWKGPTHWGLTEREIRWAHERWLHGMARMENIVLGLHRFSMGRKAPLTARKLMLEFRGLGLLTVLSRGERRRMREVSTLRRRLGEEHDMIACDVLWGALTLCEAEGIDLRKFVEDAGQRAGERGIRSRRATRLAIQGIQHAEGGRNKEGNR